MSTVITVKGKIPFMTQQKNLSPGKYYDSVAPVYDQLPGPAEPGQKTKLLKMT